MRHNTLGFQVRAADDPPSALAVVLDTAITSWIPSTKEGNPPFSPEQAARTIQNITEQLLVFLNTFTLQHEGNRIFVLLVSGGTCDLVYPTVTNEEETNNLPVIYDSSVEDESFEASTNQTAGKLPLNPIQTIQILRQVIISGVKKSIDLQSKQHVVYNKEVKVSTALSRALCLLNRSHKLQIKRQSLINTEETATAATPSAASRGILQENNDIDIPSNGRILTIIGGTDSPDHYVPMMNCMFSAQRMQVPIDSCIISCKDSTYLQQAAHLTNGVYMKIERNDSEISSLLQTLQTVFLADKQSRDFIAMPTPEQVDFRASCMTSRQIIEDGYTCSVCLSTFGKETKGTPMCPVCNARYYVPPRVKRRR